MSLRVEVALASLTWRLLLGRRRWLALILCNGLPPLLAWILMIDQGEPSEREVASVLGVLLGTVVLSVLLPLASLVYGAMAVGQEVEDGTLAYALAKPTARWRIVVTKVLVAFAATISAVVPGVWVSGWILTGAAGHALVRGFTVGVALAGLLYCAGFLALSLHTRRATILGLVYVILWEGSLSRLFEGTRAFSVREYATSVGGAVAGTSVTGPLRSTLETSTAVWMSAVLLAVAVTLAITRLRGLELVEEI
jgi:ABC-2 type transport system permease protein